MKKLVVLAALSGLASGCMMVVGGPVAPRPRHRAAGPRAAVVVAAPRLVLIAGTSVSYAADVSGDVFFYGGGYYKVSGGVWFKTPRWGGPWVKISVVPDAFLRIPASHPRYRVVKHHPKWRGRGHGYVRKKGKGKGKGGY